MGSCREGHFNLNVEMIASVLLTDIEKMSRFPIKDCQTTVLKVYGKMVSRRKTYLERKRAFEKRYGTCEGSFNQLPRYMHVLKYYNPGTIVKWKLERHDDVDEPIFNYVFWTFKPCVDGFFAIVP
ncbi:uncharacterized protein LOC124899600 [Capsicum annuum]|uniref:uncharacterized protein LOC124899600 n=1 Tax=Capsicum annuum TaxID=4072 RepID=UPI001FB0634A|nr:uncharacterized protein LOC124899600 [Capsicum annuum]